MDYRSTAVTAAIATGVAMVASGITYTPAAAGTTYASSVSEPMQASSARPAVAAAAPEGGSGERSRGYESGDGQGYGFEHEGRIHVNERDYSAFPGSCITVISGLGANSLNIRNDSGRTVEVFSGVTCDNGAPIATVGPDSAANGIVPAVVDDITVDNAVVGSFRVVGSEHHMHFDGE